MLETVAGKHRANDIASLLQNWDNVRKMQESATNATGSAAAEQEKYMQSMQGHLDQLSASWQAFSSSTMESGFMNGIIDGARGALEAITALIDKVGILPTLLGVVSGALSFKNIGFVSLQKDVDKLIPSLKVFGTTIEDYKTMWGNFGNARKEGNGFMDSLSTIFDKDSGKTIKAQSNDFVNTMKANERTILEFNSALSAQTHPTHELVDSLFEVGQAGEHASESLKKTMHELVDMKKVDSNNLLDGEALRQAQIDEHINGLANDKGISGRLKALDMFNKQYKEIGITQKEVAERFTKAGDVGMGTYLSKSLDKAAASGKQAKAGIVGYIGTLVKAKAATIGLEVASMALNTALSMGIGMLVSFGVEALMSWINRADEIAEKASDVKSSFEEQKKTLSDAKSTADELSESYAKLSQGVDTSNNKNISLNSEDYEKYLSVVREIGETFPSLIQGYDSQGNAILSCKGNVEELTQAYDEMAKKANNDVLKNSKDLAEDSKNKADKFEQAGGFGYYDSLKKIYNSKDIGEELNHVNAEVKTALADKIEKNGFAKLETESTDGYIQRAMQENKAAVKAALDEYEAQMNEAAEGMKNIAEATIGNALIDQYSGVSDNMKTMMQNLVNGMDYNFFNSDKINWDDAKLEDYIGKTLKSINDLDFGDRNKLELFFDVQSQFNGNDCTVGEYVNSINQVNKAISGLDEDTQYQIRMSLGIEDDDVVKQYDDFIDKLVKHDNISKEAAKKITNGLSKEEFQAFVELEAEGEINFDNLSTASIRKQLEDRVNLNKALKFTIDIDAETEGVEKLDTALAQARSGTGLTQESMDTLTSRYKDLNTVSFDAARLFEETANGVSLNSEAVREYENAYNTEKLDETKESLSALKDEYKNLDKQILEAQKSGDSEKVSSLMASQSDIRQKISDLAELATAYEGLTSSYNNWQRAEEAGNDRDMYQNVYSAQEGIKKELKNGWIDDGTEEYFKLIWGEDKWNGAGKSVQDYRNKWNTLGKTIKGTSYSINDFFKTNEDGELTSEGIFNFFDAVKQKQKELGKDWIKTDKNGNIKSFNFGVDGDKAVADALGISEELVQIFMRASQDCGFVVNFDGTYSQLADMQNEANAAAQKLKEMGKTKVDFDFNTTDIKSLNSQLEEAKNVLNKFKDKNGKVDFNMEGAKEAMTVASTLQATIDNMNHKYIGLTVEDDSLSEPLEKLQEYESNLDLLNQYELNPKAHTKDIENLNEKLEDTAEYLQGLSSDTKKKLNIDGLSTDEISEKLKNKEIEIPTTLDIQTKMSDDIDTLAKAALLGSGVLSDEEAKAVEMDLKAKVNVDVDSGETKDEADKAVKSAEKIVEDAASSANLSLSDSGKKRATKFFEDNKYASKYNKTQQERVVKFVADWSDIDEGKDKYTNDQIKAVVEFVKDVDDIENYTKDPIKKQAVVDFIVENQQVLDELKLDENQKKIVLDFAVNNPDFLRGLDDKQKKIAIDFVVKNQKVLDELNLSDDEKKVVVDFVAKNKSILKGLDDNQKKIAIEFIAKNKDVLDGLKGKQKKIAVDFVAKNQELLKGLSDDEKKVVVDFVANTESVDNYTPEQKTAVAQFVKDSIDVDSYSPEDRKAIAEFVKDSTDVDSYAPEEKMAIAKYAVDGGDVDNYTPKERSSIVKFLANSADPDSYTPEQKQAIVEFLKRSAEVDGYQPDTKTAIAKFKKDSSEPDNYKPKEKTQKVTAKLNSSKVDGYSPPSKTMTIWATIKKKASDLWSKVTGGSSVDGTAHVNGTAFAGGTTGKAFAQGNWGTKEDGVALMGEVGTELLVRNGRWYTVGDDGAEFVGYRRGDIIFNANQTKELFEKGKITHGNGRGKALASGTAFSNGTGASNPFKSSSSSSKKKKTTKKKSTSSKKSTKKSSSKKKTSKKKSSKKKSSKKDSTEVFDWIEVAIDRVERAIESLDNTANATFASWSSRTKALGSEISKVGSEITLQEKGYSRYMKQANSVGLSASWKKKVQDGTIDISKVKNEKLAEKIKDYQTWYFICYLV